MTPLRCLLASALLFGLVSPVVPVGTQPAAHEDVNWRIRREALEHSQIMQTMRALTDRFGPRLTGSPNLTRAADWAVERLTAWGLENGHVEPWDFGHAGWLNERLTAHIVAPVKDHLTGEVLAWTPGTRGVVRATAVRIAPPERPTAEELTVYLASLADTVRGRIVLVGDPDTLAVSFSEPAKRREADAVRQQLDARRGPAAPFRPPQEDEQDDRLTPRQVDEKLNDALVAHGALLRLDDAGRTHGQIRAFHNRTFDPARAVPTVILRNEDYGRIHRLLDEGPVELEFDIVNSEYPEGATMPNAIAELRGTDKADEIVMLGAHLDSWHAATGATDNAIGAAVVMEAIRVLKAIGVRPRRTVRIALWSGEEQGLLGSQAYVREQFGTFEDPKPAFDRFVAYVNIDSGTGRARGATVFGPDEAGDAIREVLREFEDLGVLGATTTRSRRRGGSDHTSFNEAGLAGISMLQDPIEYGTHTWHTNLDTIERIVPEDAIASATVIAALVHALATREDALPRFTAETMPRRPDDPDRPTSASR